MATKSTLGGVPMFVTGISPRIERRTTTFPYERASTTTHGVTRGQRSLDVQFYIRNDDDGQALLGLFDDDGEAVYYFDDQQRNKYSGFYVLGDLSMDDSTQATVDLRGSFPLYGPLFEVEQCLEVEFLSNDFFTATDDASYTDAVMLGMPEQASGWPKAQNLSTGVYEALSPIGIFIASASDGTEGIVEIYDAAGYVSGEPQSGGDEGICCIKTRDDQELT